MKKRQENNGHIRKLRKARIEHKYSLRDLAKLIGVHYTTVSYWENGHRVPDAENSRKLENCFNMSIEELLEDTSPKKEETLSKS